MSLITALVAGLAVTAMAVWTLVDRTGGRFWFFWIAPLIVGGLGAWLVMLTVQYWFKVGKLEVKGRPKSE